MYERFTDRARKVMQLASEEAQRFNHEYVGTEHLLLGLVREGNGVAANVLKAFDVDLPRIREQIERLVKPGPEAAPKSKLPHTPRAKEAIKKATEESRELNHKYVGTEHLLLGLLGEGEGVAAQVLLNMGIRLDEARDETLSLLGEPKRPSVRPDEPARRQRVAHRLFEKPEAPPFAFTGGDSLHAAGIILAVDIGNSRIKIGRFGRPTPNAASGSASAHSQGDRPLPEPTVVAHLPIEDRSGRFDLEQFVAWCSENVGDQSSWLVASVHRGAADRLTAAVASWGKRSDLECSVRWLTYRDVPMPIEVDMPERVGIDRLLGALAANRLRAAGRAAIVVDLGSAITVDLVTAEGAFAGGAIVPGIAMSARSLAEQTDALPRVSVERLETPPAALGRSTKQAIESGVYWGAVGAIRELIGQLSTGRAESPDVFVTGGASRQIVELLNPDRPVRHVPNLVLSGIVLADEASKSTNR